MRYVCALLCLWSNLALVEETSDPFGTEAVLPLKPCAVFLGCKSCSPLLMPNNATSISPPAICPACVAAYAGAC